jgi:DNA-binding SARP family transcriptional activator
MPDVVVRLLGPLEVGVSGRPVELRRQKQRALLAFLALRAGEVVSTDRLVEDLWGPEPPKAAVGSLQNLVSELRKALGAEVLVTRAPGYLLAVDRYDVDAHRFERLVREAPKAPAETRATALRAALALWRGPPLADLAFESFAQAEIARLDELRASTREELFAAELELGQHGPLVAELEAFVSEHPLRERPRGQLMRALYGAGRQADALEAYRQARETLVEELGIEPSSELQRLEQAILRHDPALEVERPSPLRTREPNRRKTVTIVFADVVDSSSLAAELDPEVLREVMGGYFDVVRTVVERHGGIVEKFIGDAAMAAFGIPDVHEDDALRAVRAALELHETVGALESDHGVVLRICVGVNTGEVLAGDPATGESFATGGAVVLATRLQQAALPGETLLGETTQKLVREAMSVEAVDPVDLGGALGRVPAYRALGLPEDAVGLRLGRTTALVGRAAELARLRALLAGVTSERKSRVVTLLGEAGIGKSRLTAELASSANANVLVGRCIPYGEGATYLPLVEAVRQAAPTRIRTNVASLLAGSEDADLVAQRIAELTGAAQGAASTGELFWALRRFLEALARERPVLLVLEDLHWAEPTLLDLVEYLDAWVSDASFLVLCIARPDLLERRPGWSERAIRLDRLSTAESEELVTQLADVPDALRARLVTAAEGNALFLEQLLAYVLDDEGSEEVDSLPPSIESLLASRLDRLEPEERALLERAAVVGKDFTRVSVIHLSPPELVAGIDDGIQALLRKGLIRAARTAAATDEELRFHHALVRDVAYGGITKGMRAELHDRHATWLEHRDGAPEIVGYHLEQAYRYRVELRPRDPQLPQLADRAGLHLGMGGITAWKRADTPAAVNLLGRAVALLPGDTTRGELECELAIALRTAGEVERARELLRETCARAGPTNERVALRARIELAQMLLLASREASNELLELAVDAIPVFESADDDRSLGRTWLHIAYVQGGIRGDNQARLNATERALHHYRRSGWSTAGCVAELAAGLYYGQTPAGAAIDRCRLLLAESATDGAASANLTVFLGGLEAMSGHVDVGRALAAKARVAFEEIGLSIGVANTYGTVAAAIEVADDELPTAETMLRESCDQLERMHEHALLATRASELGEVLLVQGKEDEAEAVIRKARDLAADDDVDAQTSWRIAEARLLARRGSAAESESLARAAVDLSASTDMLNRSGRSLLALAEALLRRGDDEEATEVIDEAIGMFERKGNVVSADTARTLRGNLLVS